MMPQTVPKSPMNGAVEPTVASSGQTLGQLLASFAMATSIDRSIRACAPGISAPSSRCDRRHSIMPLAKTRSDAPAGGADLS
jgi:hypothetical protein